jgi:uncharacterized protein
MGRWFVRRRGFLAYTKAGELRHHGNTVFLNKLFPLVMKRFAAQALFLIDGYNIIGAWMTLKQVRDEMGWEEARRQLIEIMTGYASFNAYEVQVVFDAQYQDTPGSKEVITQLCSVYYTNHNQTADSYIEKTCADFRRDVRKFEQRIIVATDDRALQLTAIGFGAEWRSSDQLNSEVEFSVSRVRSRQRPQGKSSGRFLMNGLDPEAQAKLDRLRFGP